MHRMILIFDNQDLHERSHQNTSSQNISLTNIEFFIPRNVPYSKMHKYHYKPKKGEEISQVKLKKWNHSVNINHHSSRY